MEQIVVRLGNLQYRDKRQYRSSHAYLGDTVFSTSSYYTFRLENLSLQIDEFNSTSYEYLEKALKKPRIYNKIKQEDIWIVGERRDKAQDTGFRFFKYMREN